MLSLCPMDRQVSSWANTVHPPTHPSIPTRRELMWPCMDILLAIPMRLVSEGVLSICSTLYVQLCLTCTIPRFHLMYRAVSCFTLCEQLCPMENPHSAALLASPAELPPGQDSIPGHICCTHDVGGILAKGVSNVSALGSEPELL